MARFWWGRARPSSPRISWSTGSISSADCSCSSSSSCLKAWRVCWTGSRATRARAPGGRSERAHPLRRGLDRFFRRFQGRRRSELLCRGRGIARRHRSEWRRQDHPAGHDLRKNKTKQRFDSFQDPPAHQHDRISDHPRRGGTQIPESFRLRRSHGARESGDLLPEKAQCFRLTVLPARSGDRRQDRRRRAPDLPGRAAWYQGRLAVARPEAVARDRHALDAGSRADAARRAGRRHERARARTDCGTAQAHCQGPLDGGDRARHGFRQDDRAEGYRAAPGQAARRRHDGAGAGGRAGDSRVLGSLKCSRKLKGQRGKWKELKKPKAKTRLEAFTFHLLALTFPLRSPLEIWNAMLEVQNLNVYYGDSHVVRNAGFALGARETLAIMGRNGMGKTTLLKALIGVLPARSGNVALDGKPLLGRKSYERVAAGLAYVPQGRMIFP